LILAEVKMLGMDSLYQKGAAKMKCLEISRHARKVLNENTSTGDINSCSGISPWIKSVAQVLG